MSEKTYKKVASHESSKEDTNHVLLLYSGGLDTSVMLKWIQDEYDAEVTTLTIDIGQTVDVEAIKAKAKKLGAKEAIVIDAKEEFAEKYLSLAIKANGTYEGNYHLFCPLGRAIISDIAVKVAHEKGIEVVAHGCTGKGNDQVRFEGYITILDPNLRTIAPVREWGMGRDEELEYADEHGIDVPHSKEKPYSYDSNIWGCSAEGGEIETIHENPPLEKILKICTTPEDAPDESLSMVISFEKGLPTAIDGQKYPLHELISKIAKIGADHGVGIVYSVEDRVTGLKVRDIYEQPAASILIKAHRALEKLVCTKDENHFKETADHKWSELCYSAKWHEPLMEDIEAFAKKMNEKVTGEVTVELYKGTIIITSMQSDYSLVDENLATFMKDDTFNQNSAAGFIELYTLPQKTVRRVAQAAEKKSSNQT